MLWAADEPMPVSGVVNVVRVGIRKRTKDAEVAAAVANVKLAECLEDRVLEILESEGAGPQSLGALQKLRDVSRLLPRPAEPPPGMSPPPAPTLAEEGQTWEATRANALRYTDSLPDFACTRTLHRWSAPANTENWSAAPTLVGDVTYIEKAERFQLRTVDGKPATGQPEELGKVLADGAFGSWLAKIFRPSSQTEHRWDHWTVLRKRPTAVYFFRIAAVQEPNIIQLRSSDDNRVALIATGVRGFVYVDVGTNQVTRIMQDAEGVPKEIPIRQFAAVLDYEYASIDGKPYLLPLRSETRLESGNTKSLASDEFRAYRKVDAKPRR